MLTCSGLPNRYTVLNVGLERGKQISRPISTQLKISITSVNEERNVCSAVARTSTRKMPCRLFLLCKVIKTVR